MKYQTYQKIINAVVIDEELTEKQKNSMFNFIKKKFNVNIYEQGRYYNVYCVMCKKNLNEFPYPFLNARRLQLLHKKKRETYDTHPGSTYGHIVELHEVKRKNEKRN